MNKIIIFFVFMFFAFFSVVQAQEISINEFTKELLDCVVFESPNEDGLSIGSRKVSKPSINETNVFFEDYNIIYEKSISKYVLKFAYFEYKSIQKITGIDIKDLSKTKEIFGKPTIPPIDSGFETIGYSIIYKKYNMKIYFYYNYNNEELSFVRFEIIK